MMGWKRLRMAGPSERRPCCRTNTPNICWCDKIVGEHTCCNILPLLAARLQSWLTGHGRCRLRHGHGRDTTPFRPRNSHIARSGLLGAPQTNRGSCVLSAMLLSTHVYKKIMSGSIDTSKLVRLVNIRIKQYC